MRLCMCRSAERNTIYCFETWAQQILDFIDEFIGEPAFVVTNSVGGACEPDTAAWLMSC